MLCSCLCVTMHSCMCGCTNARTCLHANMSSCMRMFVCANAPLTLRSYFLFFLSSLFSLPFLPPFLYLFSFSFLPNYHSHFPTLFLLSCSFSSFTDLFLSSPFHFFSLPYLTLPYLSLPYLTSPFLTIRFLFSS